MQTTDQWLNEKLAAYKNNPQEALLEMLLTKLDKMNASEKAKELYEQANYLDHPSNGVYTMTHNQRKQVAIRIAKEVLATLDSPPIRNGNENHTLWKATVDYWNDVLFACGVL